MLVAICHPGLASDSLVMLHNFFTVDVLRHLVYEEAKEVYLKSLELLFMGDSEECKDIYKQYLKEKVIERTEDPDNSLKKYYKSLLLKFKEDSPEAYGKGGLDEIIEQLG